jgi:hypothetical protein
MNLFSMILRERGYGEIFQILVHLGSETAYPFVWGLPRATDDADVNGDGLKGGVDLYGRVRKLAEMGWNPEPMIQIFVEMPDTWKVVIAMNGD